LAEKFVSIASSNESRRRQTHSVHLPQKQHSGWLSIEETHYGQRTTQRSVLISNDSERKTDTSKIAAADSILDRAVNQVGKISD
jgi:hypothetical protein